MKSPFTISYAAIIIAAKISRQLLESFDGEKRIMSLFLILLISVVIILFLNIRLGVHQSSTRLINFENVDEKTKWKLIARWGP